jgi:hypothetical protein
LALQGISQWRERRGPLLVNRELVGKEQAVTDGERISPGFLLQLLQDRFSGMVPSARAALEQEERVHELGALERQLTAEELDGCSLRRENVLICVEAKKRASKCSGDVAGGIGEKRGFRRAGFRGFQASGHPLEGHGGLPRGLAYGEMDLTTDALLLFNYRVQEGLLVEGMPCPLPSKYYFCPRHERVVGGKHFAQPRGSLWRGAPGFVEGADQ